MEFCVCFVNNAKFTYAERFSDFLIIVMQCACKITSKKTLFSFLFAVLNVLNVLNVFLLIKPPCVENFLWIFQTNSGQLWSFRLIIKEQRFRFEMKSFCHGIAQSIQRHQMSTNFCVLFLHVFLLHVSVLHVLNEWLTEWLNEWLNDCEWQRWPVC